MPHSIPRPIVLACALASALVAGQARAVDPPKVPGAHERKPIPTPDRLAAGATLEFDLPELGNSLASNGKVPIRAEVILPANWDAKKPGLPLWLHLGGDDGYDDGGLNFMSSVFDRRNVVLMTVYYPASGRADTLKTALLALKRLMAVSKLKVDPAQLGVSATGHGAWALDEGAKAGGKELAMFRYRIVASDGKLDGLGGVAKPPATWLFISKKTPLVMDTLRASGHRCEQVEEGVGSFWNKTLIPKMRTWLDANFAPTVELNRRLAQAAKAKTPAETVRILEPLEKNFSQYDGTDWQKARDQLAEAREKAKGKK